MKRIAFIGAGRMANTHAAELKKIGRTELAGVYDIDPLKAGIRETWNRCERVCVTGGTARGKTLDGVLICHYLSGSRGDHESVMEAGIRYFLRKTRDPQSREGQCCGRQPPQCHAKIMIGHHRKHDGGNKKMREIIQSGILGTNPFRESAILHTCYSRDWNDYFASYERSGGTTSRYGDSLCRSSELVFFDAEPESVYARAVMLEKDNSGETKTGGLCQRNAGVEKRNHLRNRISYQRYGIGV